MLHPSFVHTRKNENKTSILGQKPRQGITISNLLCLRCFVLVVVALKRSTSCRATTSKQQYHSSSCLGAAAAYASYAVSRDAVPSRCFESKERCARSEKKTQNKPALFFTIFVHEPKKVLLRHQTQATAVCVRHR